METKARYILVGTFVLAVTLAAFAFIYWLHNTGGLRDRQMFRIRFQSSVSGLLTGSNVLFNGIRVGEVTAVDLSADAPKEVMVTIAVDPEAPVRTDTIVNVDFQGLTGAPVIELTGGNPGSPPLAAGPEGIPLMTASADTQSLSQSARATLNRLDKVIDDNSSALHDAISGISAFASVLSRNSERIDGILAGLEKFTGGAAKSKPGIYDLTALSGTALCKTATRPQLVIPEPVSPMAFNSDRIIVTGAVPDTIVFDKAQFTDNIPSVVQTKILQSLENSKCFEAVTRPLDGLEPSNQLQAEIRQFSVVAAPTPAANVELSIKLMSAAGKIVASRIFSQTAPITATESPAAVQALDAAFGKVLAELIPWVAKAPLDAAPKEATPPKAPAPADEPAMPAPDDADMPPTP